MKPRCKGCAFTPGTEANRDRLTTLKAELCVMAYEPFLCHANAINDVIPEGKEHLCVGWVESVQGKPYPPEWKRRVALASLAEIQAAEDGKEYNEDEVNRKICQALMEAV